MICATGLGFAVLASSVNYIYCTSNTSISGNNPHSRTDYYLKLSVIISHGIMKFPLITQLLLYPSSYTLRPVHFLLYWSPPDAWELQLYTS